MRLLRIRNQVTICDLVLTVFHCGAVNGPALEAGPDPGGGRNLDGVVLGLVQPVQRDLRSTKSSVPFFRVGVDNISSPGVALCSSRGFPLFLGKDKREEAHHRTERRRTLFLFPAPRLWATAISLQITNWVEQEGKWSR